MKLFIAVFLSSMLLLPSIGSVLIYTQFKINQDKIAQTICVQKANINNSCNGRCELQKSLKKYEDNEKKMDKTNLKEKAELVYTSISIDFNFLPIISFTKKENNFLPPCEKSKSVIFSFFRPPLV